MLKIKRKALSLEEKAMILKIYDEKSKTKKTTDLAAELRMPVSTLRTILKNRKEIQEKALLRTAKRKRQKVGKFYKLEHILAEWFHQARALKQPMNGRIICEKAREIAESLHITDFTGSNGWINRFKNRYGLIYRHVSEDSETAADHGVYENNVQVNVMLETVAEHVEDHQIGVKYETMAEEAEQNVSTWMTALPNLLRNYEPQDIFNADEFGLLYKLMPDKSYTFNGEPCHGNGERLTVLACANSDGSEKLRLLIIGSEKNPRCLKNVRSLPVTYDVQSHAWMTGRRFADWLKTLDNHFHMLGRKIILFIDDCPAHPKDVELTNIKLEFIPPNASSWQPMVQGIIHAFKQGYRSRVVHRYLNEKPDSKTPLNLHDGILYIAAAWQAIRTETIQNSFDKAGFRNNVELEVIQPAILQDFSGYDIDDNVATCEDPLRFDDANTTQTETESDHEDAQKLEETPIMSDAQALTAVADLRRYVSCVCDSEHIITKLNYIENFVINNASKSHCLQSK
ncbi:tigger transposable element-derived protein 4-like [Cydia fagiglandana]|uniref:tigger transposable element-derived protein 4-like n=1 Tax=Cydia fagiglandana TaxID=1458189 RepID=UPI002FEE10D2